MLQTQPVDMKSHEITNNAVNFFISNGTEATNALDQINGLGALLDIQHTFMGMLITHSGDPNFGKFEVEYI